MDSFFRNRKKRDDDKPDSFHIPTFLNENPENVGKKPPRREDILMKIYICCGFILNALYIIAISSKDFILDNLYEKYKYYFSRSQETASGHIRIVDIILRFLNTYGHKVLYSILLLFFTYISLTYLPKVVKYVYIDTYTDKLNRTIIDPFLFTNEQDTDWKIVYDYDDNFIKWLAMKQKYEVRKITDKEVENGFLETEIYGTNGIVNVSLEIVEDELYKLSKTLGNCLNAKNLGLPLNIIFMKTTDHKRYFLIEPKITFQSPFIKKVEFEIPELNTENEVIWVNRLIEFPSELIVSFIPYLYNDTSQVNEIRLNRDEAACISFLSPRYIV